MRIEGVQHRSRPSEQARPVDVEVAPTRYQVGDLILDCLPERVTRGGRRIPLKKLSFDLLLALVRAAPELVSADRLMELVWPGLVVGPETVSQRVKRLRQALGDDSAQPRYIEGVRGRGYRIIAPVAPMAPASPSSPTSRPWRRFAIGVAALLMLLAAGAAWRVGHRAGVLEPNLSAVAVLPFANLTGEPSNGYLSDGLAAELINTLGRVPGLKVPSRTSSFAYKGRNTDIRRIAADLGVRAIVEGSVRSAGEHVRVTAELIDARTGFQMWSKDYDRPFEDIFALEDEITADVVRAFGRSSGLRVASVARAAPTSDPEAYRLLLQGEGVELNSFDLARSFFDRALERDPRFARALVDRAETYLYQVRLGMPVPNALDQAERDITRALALAPRLSTAHGALGFLSELRGHWGEAERSFREAIALDPSEPLSRLEYCNSLMAVGHWRVAQAQVDAVYRLAPANTQVVFGAAVFESLLGHTREAITLADLAVALGMPKYAAPLPLVYAGDAERHGHLGEAARYAAMSLPAPARAAGAAAVMQLVYASHADPGRRPAPRRALEDLDQRLERQGVDPLSRLQLMGSFIEIDALDEAFGLANRTLDELSRIGMVGVPWALLWPANHRRFREDPRFQALVERLGMLDYWREYGPPDGCTLAGNRLDCS